MQFQPGMYVRVPVAEGDRVEVDAAESHFRAFRLGQITEIDEGAGALTATVFLHPLGGASAQEVVTTRMESARRCAIFPGSPCLQIHTRRSGTVLRRVTDTSPSEAPLMYYVAMGGEIAQHAETDLIVPGDAQDPDPGLQLLDYELHEPGFRSLRDPVVEMIAELRNTTFGLEELVGSRIRILPHQAEVITRALGDATCRFVLADEVGLGKTIEAAVIVKGLHRRTPGLRTLIVAPASLTRQWRNELNSKFWMNFELGEDANDSEPQRLIVSADDLSTKPKFRNAVAALRWDCLIVDEAHHVRKDKPLQRFLMTVSQGATSALVLSATPIERRGSEYLDLLRLMDPERYGKLSAERFQALLDAQAGIRSSIEYVRPTLTPNLYDPDEFMDELDRLVELLPHDEHLERLHAAAKVSGNPGLDDALEAVAHVNTNYRVEHRVVRNRRAHLETELPTRAVELGWVYEPTDVEQDAIEQVTEYCESALGAHDDPVTLEYARLLLHACASSPQSVMTLLQARTPIATGKSRPTQSAPDDVQVVRSPRDEPARIAGVVASVPILPREQALLESMVAAVARWREATDAGLAGVSLRTAGNRSGVAHRILAAVGALHGLTQNRPGGQLGKAILFSSWPATLDAVVEVLQRTYGARSFTQFRAGMTDEELEKAADQFQSVPTCQVLVTDELGGEGRNFQIADGIVHLDLPWSPARIEQRIGRVDRLGREGTVISVVPYARGTVEADLFRIWHEAFSLFTRSMSGLEIALEEVQSELVAALRVSIRHGLDRLFPTLKDRIDGVRDQVEREIYFEEGAINQRQRAELARVREKYRDGEILERSTLTWATRAGLHHQPDREPGVTTFFPRSFNEKSMKNANIMTLPDVSEAIRRGGRRHQNSIRGTFDRDLAILREDFVFYAPGDDPWFEWIVQNAERADRGRCCAVFRPSTLIQHNWKGLELRYRIEVDPRPLYAAGFGPVHLHRARGYLHTPIHRVLISEDGTVLPSSSGPARATKVPFDKVTDRHLGRRSGQRSPLQQFIATYPADVWTELVADLTSIGDRAVHAEFSFLEEVGNDARIELEAKLRDAHAVRSWQGAYLGASAEANSMVREQAVIDALVAGISRPIIRLESACYWWLFAVPA